MLAQDQNKICFATVHKYHNSHPTLFCVSQHGGGVVPPVGLKTRLWPLNDFGQRPNITLSKDESHWKVEKRKANGFQAAINRGWALKTLVRQIETSSKLRASWFVGRFTGSLCRSGASEAMHFDQCHDEDDADGIRKTDWLFSVCVWPKMLTFKGRLPKKNTLLLGNLISPSFLKKCQN